LEPTTNSAIVSLVNSISPNTQFGIIITNTINPPSFAPISDPFQFETSSSDG
jgi:hypothetical protein